MWGRCVEVEHEVPAPGVGGDQPGHVTRVQPVPVGQPPGSSSSTLLGRGKEDADRYPLKAGTGVGWVRLRHGRCGHVR